MRLKHQNTGRQKIVRRPERTKMSIREFADAIKQFIENILGMEVSVLEATKLNGVKRIGLRVNAPNTNILPTLYVEPFYAMYLQEGNLQKCARQIANIFRTQKFENGVSFKWFQDFSQVREKIAYALINYEDNRELLEAIPHTRYLDLAKTYYVEYEDKELGHGIIRIYRTHLALWGITEEQLADIAEKNTPRLLPAKISGLQSLITEMIGPTDGIDDLPIEMLVLSNERRKYGAAAICYPDILRDTSTRLGSDLIIIPSSIHETILLPLTEEANPEDVNAMVSDVNCYQLETEEILSSHVYIYRRENNTVEMA